MLENLIKENNNIISSLQDPFYKNSSFIFFTSIMNAIFGFIFWIFAARYYTQENLGLVAAWIATIALIILLTQFGQDQVIIRFFPEGDKKSILCTVLIFSSILIIIFSFILVIILNFWTFGLEMIKQYPGLFLTFILINSINLIFGISFIALRQSRTYFIQNFVTGSRLIFLIPFSIFGIFGLFFSIQFSIILSLIYSSYILFKKFELYPKKFDINFLKITIFFSASNYIASLLMALPIQILPIMVLVILGAEETAIFFITFTIASFLFLIPTSFSTSLLVEGSHGNSINIIRKKGLYATYLILIPFSIILFLEGDFLLNLFGKDYVEGFPLLRLLTISSFFVAFCYIFLAQTRVQKKSLVLGSISIFILSTLLISSLIFLKHFGLIGIGYAYIISYLGSSLIILVLWIRKPLLSSVLKSQY